VSDVTAGAVLTLVIPLGMLAVVIALWAIGRGWLQLGGQGSRPDIPAPPPDS
jgi:hypothetical protein